MSLFPTPRDRDPTWAVRSPHVTKPWTFTNEEAARAFYRTLLGQRLVQPDGTIFRVTELELLHRDISEWEVIDHASTQ